MKVHPIFEQIVKESPYLVVDGELPWGFWSAGCDPDSPSAGWIIDGMGAARRFFSPALYLIECYS